MKKTMTTTLLLLGSSLASAVSLDNIRINGFLSQGYIKSDENNTFNANTKDGTIEFNEVALTLNAQITDQLRFGVQSLSRDLGRIGNNDLEIDWAIIDYRYDNWLGMQVGKMKRAYGLYNQFRDVDAARTFIFMPNPLYNENFRETTLTGQGITFYGSLSGGLEYSISYTAPTISEDGAVVSRINEGPLTSLYGQVSSPSIDAKPTGSILWNTPVDGLRVGLSGFLFDITFRAPGNLNIPPNLGGPIPPSDLLIEGYRYAISAEYAWEDFVFASEYTGGNTEFTDDTSGRELSDTDTEGYYGMVTYRVSDMLELGLAYSETFPDKDQKENDNFHKDLTIASRFDITDNWITKLEVHAINGIAEVDTSTQNIEDSWYLFAAKMTFSF